MTHVITGRDEPTVEAVAEEFVKDHNSAEIVEEVTETPAEETEDNKEEEAK